MARLTVAAGLAWAILLMCVALGPQQSQGQAPDIAKLFPRGSLPPPVKIYSKRHPSLNIAVQDGGRVVFAKSDCKDMSQKWFPLQGSSLSSTPLPFSLMSAKTTQVITIPSDSRKRLGLSSPPDTPNAVLQDQWQPEASPRDKDGFYKLFVFRNTTLNLAVLNAREGGYVPGTYPSSVKADYALWKIEPSPLCA